MQEISLALALSNTYLDESKMNTERNREKQSKLEDVDPETAFGIQKGNALIIMGDGCE